MGLGVPLRVIANGSLANDSAFFSEEETIQIPSP